MHIIFKIPIMFPKLMTNAKRVENYINKLYTETFKQNLLFFLFAHNG